MRDEGVGVHVVNAIKQRYAFSSLEVELIDGGTMGLDLLSFFEGKDKILIVDAVDFGEDPGYIRLLEDDNIPSMLNSKLSAHHIGLCEVLFAAKLMDIKPSELCLIGIQPKSIEIGLDMTEDIKVKIETLVDLVIEKLREWNVSCVLRSHQELLK